MGAKERDGVITSIRGEVANGCVERVVKKEDLGDA